MFTLSRYPVPPLEIQGASGPSVGPPLVLFHGVLRCWRDFASLWPALLPRWHVYAFDHRGHGGSDRHRGHYTVREYASDGIRLISDHFAPGVVLYGHSLGALVAAAVAATCPERVRALVLEDPPAPAFLRQVNGSAWHAIWTAMRELAGSTASVAEVARCLAEVRQPTPGGLVRLGDLRDAASLRFSARCLLDVDPDVFTPLLAGQWLEGFDLEALLAQVSCPTLLLRGDPALGGMLSRSEAEELTRRLPDGLLVDIPGVGHLLHAQAPEATLRVVLPFLESL